MDPHEEMAEPPRPLASPPLQAGLSPTGKERHGEVILMEVRGVEAHQ